MHCTAVYDLLLNVTDLFCKQHELRMSRIEGLVLKWILRRRWLFGLDDMKDGGMLTKWKRGFYVYYSNECVVDRVDIFVKEVVLRTYLLRSAKLSWRNKTTRLFLMWQFSDLVSTFVR